MGIHGDKSQQERDWVLNGEIYDFVLIKWIWVLILKQSLLLYILLNLVPFLPEFRYGKAPILIATDVASRGLGQYGIE